MQRPHRLEAQDATLSRLRLEFESPWGHQIQSPAMQGFYFEEVLCNNHRRILRGDI